MEAVEFGIKTAVLAAGAKALAGFLQGIGCGRPEEPVICKCGSQMTSRGLFPKKLSTILGPVEYNRSVFRCSHCGASRCPGDEELDVIGTMFSPGLRRMMAHLGGKSTFREASHDLKLCAGVSVPAKAVERIAEGVGQDMEQWARKEAEQHVKSFENEPDQSEKSIPYMYIAADGTGVPMTQKELVHRKGKQPDGTAKTREAKLGCVFTQTTTNEEGSPIRDPDSTSFVGKIESAEDFGQRIFAEAVRRGYSQAEKVAFIGDGAAWIWNIAETHFPGAIQIIDLYHVREHISELCKLLFGTDEKETDKYRNRWWKYLDQGWVSKIIKEATELLPKNRVRRKNAKTRIAYLQKNRDRMRYKYFRAHGLFVGSGVVEAGCKSIIGQRLKRSGMEWSLAGANKIISLRCLTASGRFNQYWEDRACAA